MRAPEFWQHRSALSAALAPAAALYDQLGALRRTLATPYRASVPVICVGNLVAGGAGKTPVVQKLAERLAGAHILSRGYGGSLAGPVRVDPARHNFREVGDEPLLLAETAPTWIARDRAAGARAAIAAGATAILMDDGLQNLGLAQDLSLMVVDGGYGFGNRLVMPAGPLRESIGRGIARAHAAVLIGEDRHGIGDLLAGRLPVIRATLEPTSNAAWRGRKVIAFAGIGRPEKFFETLESLGADIVARAPFPDHYPYGLAELQPLMDKAAAANAAVVTTAKDWVRLPGAIRTPIEVLPVQLSWSSAADIAQIDRLLDKTIN